MATYLAIDGDNIGRELEKLMVTASEQDVSDFSHRVAERLDHIEGLIRDGHGQIILRGGDSILARLDDHRHAEATNWLTRDRAELTFSAGIGDTMLEAFLALKLAKAAGKNRIVDWSGAKRGLVAYLSQFES